MKLSFVLFSVAMTCLLQLNIAQAKEAAFPAIMPEPQTAEWAQSWWMPRHEAKIKEKNEAKQVDLLFVGDSITQGWEDSGKEVWQKYYGDRNAFNLGFSGDRTEQVLWRLQHDEFDYLSPKLAVVMIGTNNTGHRQDPADQTAEGVKLIIEAMHAKMPNTHILLLGVFPRGEKADDPMRKLNVQINDTLKSMDELDYVTFLDIGGEFLESDETISAEVMPDRLHLNSGSYETWAQAIEPQVKKYLP